MLFLYFIPIWSQTSDAMALNSDSTKISIDTADVAKINFTKNFKEKYNDKAFIYEEKAPVKTLWERFQEWFSQWLERTFDVHDSEKALTILDYAINTIAVILILLVI